MFKYLILALLLATNSLVVTAGAPAAADSARLSAVLEAQVDKRKARYQWRHPQETLEFFGITPGMTVVEVLPGGGWYSSILVSYLGDEGVLVGADYPMEMWPNFPFGTDEFIAKRRAWVEDWPQRAAEWKGEDGASARAVRIGMIPDDMDGTADAVAHHAAARAEVRSQVWTIGVEHLGLAAARSKDDESLGEVAA